MTNSSITAAATLLFGSIAAVTALGAAPAQASPLTLTTSGTIDSGTDSSGLFGGAGGSLAGRSYTLSLTYADLGANVFSSPSDITATGPITGRLTATVGGVSFSAPLVNSYGALIEATPAEIYGFNVGDDNAGESLTGTNAFVTAAGTFPVSLSTNFSYAGQPADLAENAGQVSFAVAGPLGTATFFATPTSVQVAVPEPASLALAAAGLCALGLLRRRA